VLLLVFISFPAACPPEQVNYSVVYCVLLVDNKQMLAGQRAAAAAAAAVDICISATLLSDVCSAPLCSFFAWQLS